MYTVSPLNEVIEKVLCVIYERCSQEIINDIAPLRYTCKDVYYSYYSLHLFHSQWMRIERLKARSPHENRRIIDILIGVQNWSALESVNEYIMDEWLAHIVKSIRIMGRNYCKMGVSGDVHGNALGPFGNHLLSAELKGFLRLFGNNLPLLRTLMRRIDTTSSQDIGYFIVSLILQEKISLPLSNSVVDFLFSDCFSKGTEWSAALDSINNVRDLIVGLHSAGQLWLWLRPFLYLIYHFKRPKFVDIVEFISGLYTIERPDVSWEDDIYLIEMFFICCSDPIKVTSTISYFLTTLRSTAGSHESSSDCFNFLWKVSSDNGKPSVYNLLKHVGRFGDTFQINTILHMLIDHGFSLRLPPIIYTRDDIEWTILQRFVSNRGEMEQVERLLLLRGDFSKYNKEVKGRNNPEFVYDSLASNENLGYYFGFSPKSIPTFDFFVSGDYCMTPFGEEKLRFYRKDNNHLLAQLFLEAIQRDPRFMKPLFRWPKLLEFVLHYALLHNTPSSLEADDTNVNIDNSREEIVDDNILKREDVHVGIIVDAFLAELETFDSMSVMVSRNRTPMDMSTAEVDDSCASSTSEEEARIMQAPCHNFLQLFLCIFTTCCMQACVINNEDWICSVERHFPRILKLFAKAALREGDTEVLKRLASDLCFTQSIQSSICLLGLFSSWSFVSHECFALAFSNGHLHLLSSQFYKERLMKSDNRMVLDSRTVNCVCPRFIRRHSHQSPSYLMIRALSIESFLLKGSGPRNKSNILAKCGGFIADMLKRQSEGSSQFQGRGDYETVSSSGSAPNRLLSSNVAISSILNLSFGVKSPSSSRQPPSQEKLWDNPYWFYCSDTIQNYVDQRGKLRIETVDFEYCKNILGVDNPVLANVSDSFSPLQGLSNLPDVTSTHPVERTEVSLDQHYYMLHNDYATFSIQGESVIDVFTEGVLLNLPGCIHRLLNSSYEMSLDVRVTTTSNAKDPSIMVEFPFCHPPKNNIGEASYLFVRTIIPSLRNETPSLPYLSMLFDVASQYDQQHQRLVNSDSVLRGFQSDHTVQTDFNENDSISLLSQFLDSELRFPVRQIDLYNPSWSEEDSIGYLNILNKHKVTPLLLPECIQEALAASLTNSHYEFIRLLWKSDMNFRPNLYEKYYNLMFSRKNAPQWTLAKDPTVFLGDSVKTALLFEKQWIQQFLPLLRTKFIRLHKSSNEFFDITDSIEASDLEPIIQLINIISGISLPNVFDELLRTDFGIPQAQFILLLRAQETLRRKKSGAFYSDDQSMLLSLLFRHESIPSFFSDYISLGLHKPLFLANSAGNSSDHYEFIAAVVRYALMNGEREFMFLYSLPIRELKPIISFRSTIAVLRDFNIFPSIASPTIDEICNDPWRVDTSYDNGLQIKLLRLMTRFYLSLIEENKPLLECNRLSQDDANFISTFKNLFERRWSFLIALEPFISVRTTYSPNYFKSDQEIQKTQQLLSNALTKHIQVFLNTNKSKLSSLPEYLSVNSVLSVELNHLRQYARTWGMFDTSPMILKQIQCMMA